MRKCEKKVAIEVAMKAAMRAKEKVRLAAIRLILAEIKRIEVDERQDIDDARVLVVLDKMLKQRRDSFEQFKKAGRDDLAEQEEKEIAVIQEFLPAQLDPSEVEQILKDAITTTGASNMADMGKVMGIIKSKLQGRADMGAASGQLKKMLSDS